MSLTIENLSKCYGDNLVLDGIDIELPGPEILGVLGHNGAGKSTFIRCLGAEESFAGSIRFQNRAIQELMEQDKKWVAVIPDMPEVYSYLSVEEFIRFVVEFKGHRYADYEERIERWMRLFDLTPHRHKLCKDCSFGSRKKAFLIPQLVLGPRFVLLDEPTNGLDVESQFHLRAWLKTLVDSGSYVVVTSHNLDFLGKLAKRILLLKKGSQAKILSHQEGDDLEKHFMQDFVQ